jgi:predicted double-glycine peptidase
MAGILSLLLLVQHLEGFEAQHFSHVAEQRFDTSCGLLVLSDLMSRYWGYPLSVETLLAEWLSGISEPHEQEENYTISFKDMQNLLTNHGFSSKAFRFTYDQLVKAVNSYAPLILHFSEQEGHFVLCLSAQDDVLVIADPAEGVYWISKEDFLSRWQGYALLVHHKVFQKQTKLLSEVVQEPRDARTTLQNLSLYTQGVHR